MCLHHYPMGIGHFVQRNTWKIFKGENIIALSKYDTINVPLSPFVLILKCVSSRLSFLLYFATLCHAKYISQLTINQHWFWYCFGTKESTNHYMKGDIVYWWVYFFLKKKTSVSFTHPHSQCSCWKLTFFRKFPKYMCMSVKTTMWLPQSHTDLGSLYLSYNPQCWVLIN